MIGTPTLKVAGPARRWVMATALGIAAVACSSTEPPPTSRVIGIDAPSEIVAGTSVVVVVESAGIGELRLDVIDAFVTTTFTAEVTANGETQTTSFEIPATVTRSSGVTSFRAVGALGNDASASTVIVPAEATDPLDVLVGPRTIVADGADETMAIGFVTDRYGNPLLDGTPVDLSLLEEQGAVTVLGAVMQGGLAARLIGSGTVAQRVEVFASVDAGALASRRVDFAEVPGPATFVEARVLGAGDRVDPFVADGRTAVSIVTGEIEDRFGNRLPDGHLVRLQADGPDGISQLTSQTIDGLARFEFVAPRLPGAVRLFVNVDGVESEPVDVTFSAAVSLIPVEWSWNDNVLTVSVGPVLDHAGAVVVDGTPGAVAVSGLGVTPVSVELIDGRATAMFESNEQLGVGRIEVEVLGVKADEAWS